jgi:CBS domain-containing protein
MLASDILKIKGKEVITILEDVNIIDAMKILLEKKISCLPVVDGENCLIGIISDKDVFKAVYNNQDNYKDLNASQLMTTDLIVGVETDDVDYISGLMTKNRIRHIPIVEEMLLVGLISIGDVVKTKQKDIEIENRYLRQYIDGSYPG